MEDSSLSVAATTPQSASPNTGLAGTKMGNKDLFLQIRVWGPDCGWLLLIIKKDKTHRWMAILPPPPHCHWLQVIPRGFKWTTKHLVFGLMLKLQHYGQLMRRSDSTGKDPDAGQRENGAAEDDSWMASLTQWAWIWANSGRREEPGVLQFMGSQRIGHDLSTE